MLVPAMNLREIIAQIRDEHARLCRTTLLRLTAEYDRERKKKKIPKSDSYPREYEIRTKGKNNWIIFMHMPPGVQRYAGPWCIYSLSVVYYYSNQGFKAFSLSNNTMVGGYTSHFFKRYNQRMNLKLSNIVDVLKAYFKVGNYVKFTEVNKHNNRPKLIGFRSDGILFAEVFNDEYMECKTFVNYELIRPYQEKIQEKLRRENMQCIEDAKKTGTSLRVLESLLNSASSFSMQYRA